MLDLVQFVLNFPFEKAKNKKKGFIDLFNFFSSTSEFYPYSSRFTPFLQ